MSKVTKERKARERYDKEAALAREERGTNWTPPLAVLGVVVGLIGTCYVLHRRRQRSQPSGPSEQVLGEDVADPPSGRKRRSIDQPPTRPTAPASSTSRFDSPGDSDDE